MKIGTLIQPLLNNYGGILLLKSPCNKLFKNDIIRKHNIAFDVNLSYLEDMCFNYFYLKKK